MPLLSGELKKAGIPYTPAVGAIFMWVDLRGALPSQTWEVIHQALPNPFLSMVMHVFTSPNRDAMRNLDAQQAADIPDVIGGMLSVQEEERFWDEVVKAGVLLTPGEVPCSFNA